MIDALRNRFTARSPRRADEALKAGDRSEQEIDRIASVLAHLTMHQTHHRGQAHAMLSGTTVAPPQLDEFLMPSETALRVADLQALGWTERDLFGGR